MTRIDEFWSFSYIISMNRLKNVYDVDFALSKGYIQSVDEEPNWNCCGAARFMCNNPSEAVMDKVYWSSDGNGYIKLEYNGVSHCWGFNQKIIGFKFENGQLKTFNRSDYGGSQIAYINAITSFLQTWKENGYELEESVIIQDDEDFVI